MSQPTLQPPLPSTLHATVPAPIHSTGHGVAHAPAVSVRALRPSDRPALASLIGRGEVFSSEEVAVALELIDAALVAPAGDYRVLVADAAGRVAGYVCFGPTPMTEGTFDLYWIATALELRGQGVGTLLVEKMEDSLRALGARLVRVETSNLDGFGSAHRFYLRHGYPEVSRLRDFYKPGDDLITMLKRL